MIKDNGIGLDSLRCEIDEIDLKMRELFVKRMRTAEAIAEYKLNNSLPIFDEKRERAVIEKNAVEISDADLKEYYERFLVYTMSLSKDYQKKIIANSGK